MKKFIIMSLMIFCAFGYAEAQNKADIKFDKTSHNFGAFSEKSPIQKCTFTFTNVGNAPLVINQVVASCGCTVPAYTKEPIAPGKKGEVTITYNGTGKPLGHFKKNITIRTNAVAEMTRIYVEGEMTK
ncbi:DUF1573 domain-containing protein [Prevotella sp. OH937_COT-195]|uniref:DUF1573 domain-containing protein n=1 Tax=Prevotella sp. OH937_COT-195 TaxID=2491051 RepID=UPI000F647D5E|nr:DUF1573 domain-containing protein [Prevotella sp. OH937_COT-195]RRD03059.1 DUF1573 domain-containing protein [Prevotella sp. OH937_COT-195]